MKTRKITHCYHNSGFPIAHEPGLLMFGNTLLKLINQKSSQKIKQEVKYNQS